MKILNPASDQIWVNATLGETTATTPVHYDASGLPVRISQIFLWARVDAGPWKAVSPLPHPLYGAFLTEPLVPGGVYRVRAYLDAKLNPNVSGENDHIDEAVVFCFRKEVESDLVLAEKTLEAGGTYYWIKCATRFPSRIKAWVTKQEPKRDPNGLVHWNLEEGRVIYNQNETEWSLDAIHEFQVTPLASGVDYYCIIRISDSNGNWKFLVERFKTKLRRVEIVVNSLYILNSGEDDGEGRWECRILQDGLVDGQFQFPASGTHDHLNAGQTISLNWRHIYGPDRGNVEDSYDVNVYGVEEDGAGLLDVFDPNAICEIYCQVPTRRQPFPYGRIHEATTKAPLVETSRYTKEDFLYNVIGYYSVDYV